MKCPSGNTSFLLTAPVNGDKIAIVLLARANTNMNTTMRKLSKDDLSRFTRHFSLPEIGIEGQEKLKNARVLVIGAGGLGSPLLIYLASAGLAQLVLLMMML